MKRLSASGKSEYRAQLIDNVAVIASLLRDLDTYEGKKANQSAVMALSDNYENRPWRKAARRAAILADNRSYWERRLITSLALGNAAGAVGAGSFLASSSNIEEASILVGGSFLAFLAGAFISALVPLALQRMAHFELKEAEADADGDDEYQRGHASAQSLSASSTWSGIVAAATYLTIFLFATGAAGIAAKVRAFSTSPPAVEQQVEPSPTSTSQ